MPNYYELSSFVSSEMQCSWKEYLKYRLIFVTHLGGADRKTQSYSNA